MRPLSPFYLPSRRTVLHLAVLSAAGVGLAACGHEKTLGAKAGASAAAQNASKEATDSFPVTIEHVYGATVIEREPRRIATVSAVGADVVMALGVVPVGMPAVTWGGDSHSAYPWTSAALESMKAGWDTPKAPILYSETDGLNSHVIEELRPDLILGVFSNMTRAQYDSLSAIAPTIAYPKGATPYGTAWEESITLIGTALGRAVTAEALIRTTSTEVTAAAAQYPELARATFAAIRVDTQDPSTLSLYTKADNRVRVMTLLGMTPSESSLDAGAGDTSRFSVSLPASAGRTLDADLMWVWIDDGSAAQAGGATFEGGAKAHPSATPLSQAVPSDTPSASARQTLIDAVKNIPAYAAIPAIASGRAVFVTDPASVMSLAAASPLSLPWFCVHHLPEIGRAAASALASPSATARP